MEMKEKKGAKYRHEPQDYLIISPALMAELQRERSDELLVWAYLEGDLSAQH